MSVFNDFDNDLSRSLSRGLPIVRPEWIVDSIAASRVLHCKKLDHKQKIL